MAAKSVQAGRGDVATRQRAVKGCRLTDGGEAFGTRRDAVTTMEGTKKVTMSSGFILEALPAADADVGRGQNGRQVPNMVRGPHVVQQILLAKKPHPHAWPSTTIAQTKVGAPPPAGGATATAGSSPGGG